jgi:hypothetical protein
LTINYLKPFEPGEPIDINTLNKLIQNVNFLASQIAQIYRLPAVQAPVVTVTGATGSTSGGSATSGTGNDTGSGNTEGVNSVETVHLTIARTVDFRKVGQTFTYTLSTATVEAQTKKKVKSWKILNAGYSNLSFVPNKKPETNKTSALGAKISKISTAGAVISFIPGKDTDYKAGSNAPMTSGSAPWYRLYFNLELSVEVTY